MKRYVSSLPVRIRRKSSLCAVGIMFGCLVLTACGSIVTVVVPATTVTTTAQPAGTPQTATDCGTIFDGPGGVTTSNYQTIEQCYFQAYVACQPAKLLFTQAGIDTSTDHQLSLAIGSGACHPVDVATFHGCCSSTDQTTTTTYQCASAVEENGRLIIKNCGTEGDVALP